MCNLTLVINDDAIANNRIIQCTTVNRCTGTDLNPIANMYRTELWYFYPVATIICIAKTICTNDRTGLNQTVLPDYNFMINGNIGPQTATSTNVSILTNKTARTDNHVITQYYTGLYHCICTDRNILTQRCLWRNHRTWSNILRRLRCGIHYLSHACIG
ncbi:Uncharacterised protein [Yersinia enterocolitica]|nr:Uncharacterised protein [Yersinia enterocolitica]